MAVARPQEEEVLVIVPREHAVAAADGAREQGPDLLGRGIRDQVPVLRLAPQQPVAHAPARQQHLVAVSPQPVDDEPGSRIQVHGTLKLSAAVTEFSSPSARLLAMTFQ